LKGRRNTQVGLVADTGHCAASTSAEVLPKIVSWLVEHLATSVGPYERT
jgi:hypothetical protein